jgi:outer membrane protein insertion porin family
LEKQVNRLKRKKLRIYLLLVAVAFATFFANAQIIGDFIELDYNNPQRYKLEDIEVEGNKFTDKSIIELMSGLSRGQNVTLPGDETRLAIEKLWKQGLFSDIEISAKKKGADGVILIFNVTERPRLSKYSIKGLRKSETGNVRDEISLKKNQLISEELINTTKREINDYFFEKGFYGVKTEFTKEQTQKNPTMKFLRLTLKRERR